jgi:lambda repressor-like predicted transcriptional regulator
VFSELVQTGDRVANENLKNALETAGLTVEQFADIIQVDPKSVQRWVTGPTIPYPRHRAKIASALDLSEHDLWPERAPKPSAAEPNQTQSPRVNIGGVTGVWAYANDAGAPDPVAFVANATAPIDVLDSSCEIQITAQLTDVLRDHAAAGHPVRILTDGRAPHWEPLLTDQLIELYVCEIPGEYWLLKTDERMVLAINLEQQPAGALPPPLLELTAASGDGLFRRLAAKFEELWKLTEQIDTGGAEEVGSAQESPTVGSPPAAESDKGSVPGARRWPGQRS